MNEENNTTTATSTNAAPEGNKLMAALAYIGPLVIISYLVAKDDPFTKFHIKQGLVLFSAEVILWVLSAMAYMLYPFIQLVNLAIGILAIVGIVNAIQGKEKILPLVGQYADKFKI